MIFFFDENFPKKASDILTRFGHSFIDIRGTEDEGLNDSEIFQLCKKYFAIFLTTDRDFYHTIHLLQKPHYGIVVIALKQPNGNKIIEKLKWFLNSFDIENMDNKCYLILDNQCRIY